MARTSMAVAAVGLLCLATGGRTVSAQSTFTFTTLAGWPAFGSNDGASTRAAFRTPADLAITPDGITYVADAGNHTIRRIGTDGTVTTVAGFVGVGGGENLGALTYTNPHAIAVDELGSVYVRHSNLFSIRKISPDGVVTSLTHLSDLNRGGLVVDNLGHIYFTANSAVWRMSTSGGNSTLIAGSATETGYVDGTGATARFRVITDLAIDDAGNLYVADAGNFRVRRVTPEGLVMTVGSVPVGSVATTAADFSLAVDVSGVIWIADASRHSIVRMTQDGSATVIAGSNEPFTFGYRDGIGADARFSAPRGIAVSAQGLLYVADSGNSVIRTITPAGVVRTVVGMVGGAGIANGMGRTARFDNPKSIAIGAGGVVFVADRCLIRRVAPDGSTTNFGVASPSESVFCGLGFDTTHDYRVASPAGIAVDAAGHVLVADTGANSIVRITEGGQLTTVAGQAGTVGSTDGQGQSARFSAPSGIALDAQGNLYVADTGNHLIRVVTPSGVVSTLAGTPGVAGIADGTGTAARFNAPRGVAVDTLGNVFVADTGNNCIRKIRPGGVVTTLAGAGFGSYAAPDVALKAPEGLTVDPQGNVIVADTGNHQIRRITPDGLVSFLPPPPTFTQLGTDRVALFILPSLADGPPASARFWSPSAVALDAAGNLYVADTGNHAIRVGLVSPTAPSITAPPASTTVDTGATATFTVAAVGNLRPEMRWQVSTDAGNTWTDLDDGAPYSGVTTATLTVASVTTALHRARYRAVATNQSGRATSASATLSVSFMAASPTALRFGAIKNGAGGAITSVTPAQTVTVSFTGTTATWSASVNQLWVTLTNVSGAGNGRFSVAVSNPDNVLGASTSVSATITLTPSVSALATVTIPVMLTVHQVSGTTAAPIGQVDTPAQNATGVQGAIALTGWVLDDVGIASVKVYRNWLSSEPYSNCRADILAGQPGVSGTCVVYIGDASLVAGARPDVEAAFPSYPAGHTAGWGIQVLTKMLPSTQGTFAPSGGQGPITFYAVATDLEGQKTVLSRAYTDTVLRPTSLTMNNDAIAKPFGTIDTPAEGSTVSGMVANFGWAITPDSDTAANSGDILIPTTGSTMVVFIDGAPVSTVAYNQCRGTVGNPVPSGVFCDDDVSNIFGVPTPQAALTTRTANATVFRNLDAGRGAIGAYVIDTTTLSTGLHTLAWSVTDSANRVEGIGSRYINVLNSADASVDARVMRGAVASRGAASTVEAMPIGDGIVRGRTGFDLSAAFAPIAVDDDGVRRVTIAATGRLELRVGAVDRGYLVANGSLRDLPVGSQLDPSTGVFTWAPGPGFLGTYRLVFVNGETQVPVDVTLAEPHTAAAGQSEILMHLDTPTAGSAVGRTVTLAGWALDPQAFTGSGIGAVHVWAQRLDAPGSTTVFVGDASLDGQRPDVAAAHGAAGARSGFSLTARLGPGMYALTAYAWNTRTQRWEDARTVSVTVR